MIDNKIQNSNYYNSINSSNNTANINKNVATDFNSLIAGSSNTANKYMDTVQQFSNITKISKSTGNAYNNAIKNYDTIPKSSNGVEDSYNSENNATENVDPNDYNIPVPTIRSDPYGTTYHTGLGEDKGVLFSGSTTKKMVFDIRYAEHSTDENPIMSARGQDEYGEPFTQLITLNKVNPSDATPVEIIALQSHLQTDEDELSIGDSFLMDGSYGYNEHGGNLNDRNNYISSLRADEHRYSYSINSGPEVPLDLTTILNKFTDFMNKHNIAEQDDSAKLDAAYKQSLLTDASEELDDLVVESLVNEANLEDELLEQLDTSKDDDNVSKDDDNVNKDDSNFNKDGGNVNKGDGSLV